MNASGRGMLRARALTDWAKQLERWELRHEPLPAALLPAMQGIHSGRRTPYQPAWGPEAAAGLSRPLHLAPYLDHTLLRPDATRAEAIALADEARAGGFAGACVSPVHLGAVAERLAGSSTAAVAVVGFPSGAHRTEIKAAEAALAIRDGAREVDVVVALGALRAGELASVLADVQAVVQAAGEVPVKLILEAASLPRALLVVSAGLAMEAGCAWVKTSTGFGATGARVEDVQLLRACVGPQFGVKASGGVRTRVQALALIAAGASRIGTSASLGMVNG